MRLLVSVRSAEEVAPALAGGADIIDAKEPELGSLGPVAPERLRAIATQLPEETEFSIALGDFSASEQVAHAVSTVPVSARPAALYLKLGFAGVGSDERIGELLATARTIARSHPAAPRIIAVAYADAGLAGSADPAAIVQAAGLARCDGVLLDTHEKGGANLFDWISPVTLRQLIGRARECRLLTAVAGGLTLEDLEVIGEAEPDVVGFRSAACRGGRNGRVSSILVRELRNRLPAGHSGFLQ
jgi:(5-formylfuran-3-yl)methyl phosphate synthase